MKRHFYCVLALQMEDVLFKKGHVYGAYVFSRKNTENL